MVIAAGVALGVATFITIYIIFAVAGRTFLQCSKEAGSQGKPGKSLFLSLLSFVSVVIALAGGIGAGLLVALSTIGA